MLNRLYIKYYVLIPYYKFKFLIEADLTFFVNVTLCTRGYMCLETDIIEFTKCIEIVFLNKKLVFCQLTC